MSNYSDYFRAAEGRFVIIIIIIILCILHQIQIVSYYDGIPLYNDANEYVMYIKVFIVLVFKAIYQYTYEIEPLSTIEWKS